ncbi:hypothetical protein QN362_05415 [Actimicrobium sp. CCC2.4]|uniref:hypothetical protein n=1 Tax=Actimicrobium sp. CCC2.4 TaxID=3048606 RepID=UPI002AC92CA6|nr:hypothetical protein [Actimicrobium sp. CCC2.4]MEB0134765.1 hypothetical protein [Actimicrobium sp. CCC2.4]WPX30704.1 hypothetical protein RHM62_10500 [Actimicrobium sp. CCC2.4]
MRVTVIDFFYPSKSTTAAAPVSARLSVFCTKQTNVDIKNTRPAQYPMTISQVNVQAINMLRVLKAPTERRHPALKPRLHLRDPDMSIASYWQLNQNLLVSADTGTTIAALPRRHHLPPLINGASLLRCHYVIKDAASRSEIIIKHVRRMQKVGTDHPARPAHR